MIATLKDGRLIDVIGDRDHPLSQGYSCPKGRALPELHQSRLRLSHPRVHGSDRAWEPLLDELAREFRRHVDADRPNRIGMYTATGLYFDTAGWWAAERWLRATGSQQRYTSVTVDISPLYRAAELVTGFWSLWPAWDPASDSPRLTLVFGSNLAVSHGYAGTAPFTNPARRLRDYQRRGGQVWVFDPRKTKTTRLADHHVALRPGTDSLILGWLVRELLDSGYDSTELEEACEPADVAALRNALKEFTLDRVAEISDVDPTILLKLLATVRECGQVAAVSGTGLTFARNGILAEWLRWALLIVTGSLDRPGGMAFSTGTFAPFDAIPWGDPAPVDGTAPPGPASRPELPTLYGERPCAALLDEIESGQLTSLVVAGGNPLTAFPEPDRTRAALKSLDTLVVIDAFESELSRLASHVLPTTWHLERADVFFTDRAMYSPAALPVEGERRHAWWIFGQLARRMGLDVLDGLDPETCSETDVLRLYGAIGRFPFDDVVASGTHGLAAPVNHGWVHDRVLANGRWRLAPTPLLERLSTVWNVNAKATLLVSGRILASTNSAHYSGAKGAETGTAPPIGLSASVAAGAEVVNGDRVRVSTPTGAVEGPAIIDDQLREGTVWINHGWAQRNVATLVDRKDIDVLTGQPHQSALAVTIERLA